MTRKITPNGDEIVYVYDAHNRLEGKFLDNDHDDLPDAGYEPWDVDLHRHGPA